MWRQLPGLARCLSGLEQMADFKKQGLNDFAYWGVPVCYFRFYTFKRTVLYKIRSHALVGVINICSRTGFIRSFY
jgi:hypothetical protein